MATIGDQRYHQPTPETAVVGMGVTGLSVARYLVRRGEAFVLADSRTEPPLLDRFKGEFPNVPMRLGAFDETGFMGMRRLVVSPGVPVSHAAIQAAVRSGGEILGDIELFSRDAGAPVLAVTGSNGKSTVATLLGRMLDDQGRRVAIGGNLGTPALDLLDDGNEAYVMELSSFQLETTRGLAAAVAVVLNISADHMDRYASIADYAAAKQRIFRGSGMMVLNADDPLVMAMQSVDRETLRFTLKAPGDGEFGLHREAGETWLARGRDKWMRAGELGMRGRHNLANALAALAMGYAYGLEPSAMCESLRGFAGLPHRCQWLGEKRGVGWYNDSKGTNVGATVAALQGVECNGRIVLLAGGLAKDADFSPLLEVVRRRVRGVVLFGRDARRIETALSGAAPCVQATDMNDAVRHAARLARAGDAVLLSPACASFDMFSDYQARGDAFVQAVSSEVGS